MPKIQVATVGVIVTRDPMTILHREVPAHERDVLLQVFGEDNVQADESAKPEPVGIDTDSEAERLQAKYGGEALEATFGKNLKFEIPKAAKAAEFKPAKAKA